MERLTMLSMGGGQDSTAILYKLLYDKMFRQKYAPGDLIVVMSDTGNEHPETEENVSKLMKKCKQHNIPFFLLDNMSSDFPENWRGGLISFYTRKTAIGSKAYPKSCTDNLKIRPIYNWLDGYVYHKYGLEKRGRKAAIKEFAEKYGKIDVLIGIAKGEEKRASTNESSPHLWMRNSINKVYPLIDLKMDRQACQDYIRETGNEVPPPSNCILCPFLSKQELLYMRRKMPEWFDTWVALERRKLEKHAHEGDIRKAWSEKEKKVVDNLGVWGKQTLEEVLIEAEEEFGHMTMEELHEYKMSHGHCVMSKY